MQLIRLALLFIELIVDTLIPNFLQKKAILENLHKVYLILPLEVVLHNYPFNQHA